MKTVLEVICKVKGWRGGTIHQAIAEYKQMSVADQQKVIDLCQDIPDHIAGKVELINYFKGV